MNLQNYLSITDDHLNHFADVYARYKRLHTHPDQCSPMLIINTPVEGLPDWEARLTDPLIMLKAELDALQPHLAIRDDRVPSVRVQFGTAQVAAAFGCDMVVPPNSLPAAGSHVLTRAEDAFTLEVPSIDAGWYEKLWTWTRLWQENLPRGVHIQMPDIQSPFNTAHLVRGNDILTDFYDCPDAVEALLDRVTDFMIRVTQKAKSMIVETNEWFFDWGGLWKGCARISNCSMHMINPDFYRRYVFARDVRFFNAVGGGRMHYCGSHGEVIDEFCRVPAITGLDVDLKYHDFFALCDAVPAHLVLMPSGGIDLDSDLGKKLLEGRWPKKRNIILHFNAPDIEERQHLLSTLRSFL